MKLIKHFRENSAIWLCLLFFWSICVALLAFYRFDVVDAHLFINRFTTKMLNAVMFYTTHLGDGIVMLILSILAFFVSTRYFFNLALTGLILMPTVYFLKRFLDHDRPITVFEKLHRVHDLYIPYPEDLNVIYSFPSGHASVAFAMAVSHSPLDP